MLLHYYLDQQIEYEKKYGEHTLVLMQVGSFFEFYGVDNDKEKIGDTKVIAELLNIQLTRRNKAILENSKNNCLMAGFPTHSLKRFIQILISHNYTIVLIEQVTPPPNPKREITQIFSPGTYLDEIVNYNPNNIVSLYLNHESCFKTNKDIYVFGLASIDLSTGKNYLYEAKMNYYDKNAYFEEIYRFLETFNPKEIIINYSKKFEDSSQDMIRELSKKINLENRLVHYKNIETQFENIHYQNTFLSKIFNHDSLLQPLEYLDLELHEKINEQMSITKDRKTGFIKISFEHQSPVFAFNFLRLVIRELNRITKKIELDESQSSLNYLYSELSKINERDVRDSMNNIIESQLTIQMLANVRSDYMLQTIDAPYIPEVKSKPSRSIICIISTIIGFIVSILFILIRFFIYRI